MLTPTFPIESSSSSHSKSDAELCRKLLSRLQTLRGRVYLEDGAIQAHELTDGRHEVDSDWRSWHLLIIDADYQVHGCARYTPHPNETRYTDLTVSHSSLARCDRWGTKLKAAVESELELASRSGLPYVEVGGWALSENVRGTAEALRMVLAIYALAQEQGGVMGISTATVRHCSASILKRIGGFTLDHEGTELPPYFDHQYNCEMEVLRFHSWAPNPRFMPWIDQIKSELRDMPILTLAADRPRPN